MKILNNLPKDYTFDLPLGNLDNENLNAKIMVSIFKELNLRIAKSSHKCPWCKHDLS